MKYKNHYKKEVMKKLVLVLTVLTTLLSCSIEHLDKTEPYIPLDGLNGLNGEQGIQGLTGIQGIQGEMGVAGENGLSTWYYTNEEGCIVFFQYRESNDIQGAQDDEERVGGESGAICIRNGIDGADGQDGSDGIDGTNGTDGQNGSDGINGTNGENGSDGQNGSDGTDGEDGSDGENGFNTLIKITKVEDPSICEHGGKEISTGLDTNRDDILQDSETDQTIIWCLDKCPVICTDVTDTVHCSNGKVYVMWIDGVYFYNIDLQFEEFDDGTATLHGKVKKHNSTKTFLVDVEFSDIVVEPTKDHNCLNVDNSEWIQYATMSGVIRAVDGSVVYTVSRRGEPFQVGVGANPTSSENVKGASSWFLTDGHNQCKGDFNFNYCK